MNTNHDQVEDLLNHALEFPSEQRAAFLAGACGSDKVLRDKVETLLKAHVEADGFLPDAPTALNAPLSEGPGTQIDKYKLLEKLGEGGFGVVYMAEQREPVKRRVALKIIKIGMDTREVVARFEAERQALAMMDHPNIAKILDAGVTGSVVAQASPPASSGGVSPPGPTPGETPGQPAGGDACATLSAGRPYFVMELVRGIKITDYCDEKKLSTQERLDLFIKVCQAIQHAHQKGIIHRDLKPSNILVTVNDGVAVPKVIDFGIAKATQAELTGKTLFTRFHQFLGTPAYMSPEQAEMTSLDIDTRSDIYSLGVLLYELLTGKTPFDANELLKAGLDEMRRTIREKEPDRPSTRVSTLRGDELTTTAKRRGLDAPKLINVLRGDLDWIVMKCLEKDRARRYETANGLASDIQRHLSNEPVVACPPSNFYRLQKLVRRNKLAFASGTGIAAALIVGLAIALWQSVEKTRAYKQAQTEAARSRHVATLLQKMLKSVGPSVALGRDTRLLQEILDNTAESLGKELTNEPEVEAELCRTIASVYYELWQDDKALAMYQRSLDLLKKVGGTENEAMADALNQLAMLFARSYWKYEEGEKIEREALRIYEKLHGHEHTRVALALNNLTFMLANQAKLAEGESAAREALRINRKLLDPSHPYVGLSLSRLGLILQKQAKLDAAESVFQDAVAIQRKALGTEPLFGLVSHHSELAWTLIWRSSVFVSQGRLDEAEKVRREALALARMVFSDEHPDIALYMTYLADVLTEEKKLEEAEGLYRQAVELKRKKPEREFLMLHPLVQLRGFALKRGDASKAQAAYDEILAIAGRLPPAPIIGVRLVELTGQLLDEKNFAQAELRARDSLAIFEKTKPWRAFEARSMLGVALLRQNKYPEAENELLAAFQGLQEREDRIPVPSRLVFLIQSLLQLYKAAGRPDQLNEWQSKLAALYRKAADQGDATAQSALGLLCLHGEGVPKDAVEAAKWLRKAAEQGNAVAQSNFGFLFERGNGVSKDLVEAARWYRKAAEQGNAAAQNNLGYLHARGEGVAKDPSEAVKWYRRAADQGDEAAQNGLGLAYYDGNGVAKDATEAVYWFRKAADQGNAMGEFNLGLMYYRGEGVVKDLPEAVNWYRKAADHGYADAQHDLGYLYRKGEGVEKDAAEAVKWFRRAADNGNADSRRHLAQMYERGEGVIKDPAEVLKWRQKAAESGDALDLNNLAWLLATCPYPELRDGRGAVTYAEKAAAASSRTDASYLDTLAAAYAEAGDFAKAVAVQKEAMTLSLTEEEKKDLTSHLRLYESGLPYRERE